MGKLLCVSFTIAGRGVSNYNMARCPTTVVYDNHNNSSVVSQENTIRNNPFWIGPERKPDPSLSEGPIEVNVGAANEVSTVSNFLTTQVLSGNPSSLVTLRSFFLIIKMEPFKKLSMNLSTGQMKYIGIG